MKKLLSIILILCMLLTAVSCKKNDTPSNDNSEGSNNDTQNEQKELTINGVKLSEFTVVYDEEGLDYNKRAAEYIKNAALERAGVELTLTDDSSEPTEHEIVVGETSRAISASLNEDTSGFEFAIMEHGGSIALEGDYFVIAAAAYYFTENYIKEAGFEAAIPEGVSIHEPIVKEAKNFIILIGDGMGVNQTLLYDQLTDTSGYSDGENQFYGYMFPYQGFSRTESLSGVTDSAAGGTAISCGTKTLNEHIGKDKDMNDLQSLTELAGSLGMATGVMSTEVSTGATPASFSAHATDRDSNKEILDSQEVITNTYGTVIDCGFDYYTARYMKVIENHISETLATLASDEDGFFLMYEEAHIDKHCHKNDIDKTFLALIRFNQAIARFMEFAFYNPDTFVLITADHETGSLHPNEEGVFVYNSEEHSADDVPIFTYGYGSELFDGKTVENIQIGHTVASFMGVYDFGDQSEFTYLK